MQLFKQTLTHQYFSLALYRYVIVFHVVSCEHETGLSGFSRPHRRLTALNAAAASAFLMTSGNPVATIVTAISSP